MTTRELKTSIHYMLFSARDIYAYYAMKIKPSFLHLAHTTFDTWLDELERLTHTPMHFKPHVQSTNISR